MDEHLKAGIHAEVNSAIKNSQGDLLNSLSTLIDARLESFQRNITDSQKSMNDAQMARIDESLSSEYKFKKRGNEEQYKHNNKVSLKLREASNELEGITAEKVVEAKPKISEGMDIIKSRQKLIKLADSSKAGWKAADEYTTNPIAEDSDDEKKIKNAQDRAEKKLEEEMADRKRKSRQISRFTSQPSQTGSQNSIYRPGKCFKCGSAGHWRKVCMVGVVEAKETQAKISKNFGFHVIDEIGHFEHDDVLIQSPECVKYNSIITGFDQSVVQVSNSPVGRLKDRVEFWRSVGANEQELS